MQSNQCGGQLANQPHAYASTACPRWAPLPALHTTGERAPADTRSQPVPRHGAVPCLWGLVTGRGGSSPHWGVAWRLSRGPRARSQRAQSLPWWQESAKYGGASAGSLSSERKTHAVWLACWALWEETDERSCVSSVAHPQTQTGKAELDVVSAAEERANG